MTDYLGPLVFGATGSAGTYSLETWSVTSDADGLKAALVIYVRAASADALATAIGLLSAQLRAGNSYVHFFPGVTNPVVYRITGSSGLTTDEAEGALAFWTRCTFTLTLATMPAGALQTPYNAAAVNLPASASLAALLGSAATPLDVTVRDASGNLMHSVWAALAPTALSDAKWLRLASALTWTSMSAGSGADMWGNVSAYTTSAAYQTAPLDTWAYPAGKYRLLARVKMSAGSGWVMDSQNQIPVAVTRTSAHLLVIGDLDLPVADSAPGTPANLTLSVKSDGTNTLTVNGFVLLPLEYGYFSWHHATPTSALTQLDVGPTGTWIDGAYDATYLQGGPLVPGVLAAHAGSLVATASPSGSVWPPDWGRTNGADVTATAGLFQILTAAGGVYAWNAATVLGTPIVVPGQWYEVDLTRQVTARSAGSADVLLRWQDVDGNAVREDTLASATAVDGSPVALALYAKAPTHAVRAQVRFGAPAGANLTAQFSAAVLRRCPLRLILVAEAASGALASNAHPAALTVRYTPRYEVAR